MNSFGSRSVLRVGKREFEIYRLDALEKQGCRTAHLPYSLRILPENRLRPEDGKSVKAAWCCFMWPTGGKPKLGTGCGKFGVWKAAASPETVGAEFQA